jgi:N-glycosylase/DNA lyase
MKIPKRFAGLISEYKAKRRQIKKRIREFRRLRKADDEDIFAELCFCILTPQSKAVYCDKAVQELKRTWLLFNGCLYAIKSKLKGVRFPNNKAAYLVAVREFFRKGRTIDIKSKLDTKNILTTRDWLVKNVKGLGYKEASHFLRNIGLGKDLAILDVHILKNLKKYRIIGKIPASISRKTYLNIEARMRDFSRKINIPMEELDLLFWSNQTGFIFK